MLEVENLTVKVLKTHKTALKSLARLEGEPMSVVLRGLIRDEARRRGVWPEWIENHSQAGSDVELLPIQAARIGRE